MTTKRILVTGGASFIGSHLVDTLLKNGATVSVADDFSSGNWPILNTHSRRQVQPSARAKKIVHDLEKPQGAASRAASLTNAKKRLGWRPKVDYKEGFEKTIKWYFTTKNENEIRSKLERLQTER